MALNRVNRAGLILLHHLDPDLEQGSSVRGHLSRFWEDGGEETLRKPLRLLERAWLPYHIHPILST